MYFLAYDVSFYFRADEIYASGYFEASLSVLPHKSGRMGQLCYDLHGVVLNKLM